MTEQAQLHALMGEAMQAYGPFYRETMQQAIQDSPAPDHWFVLNLAHGSDPEPFTLERFRAMAPYGARDRLAERLEQVAQLDLIERVGEQAYRLTDRGREVVEGIFEVAQRDIGAVEPLPDEEMDQLNGLLYRLVEGTLAAPEPEEKWFLAYSRWTDPGEGAPRSVKTDQYLTDLLRYRDDAHLAAWKSHNISGHAWEALTYIWRDEAGTAEELAEQLSGRGHTVEVYQNALGDLAGRGWVVEEGGRYKLTEEGRQVREEAEEATNRYYFTAWTGLSDAEKNQLVDLLTRLRDSLHEMAGSEEEA